jgi:polyisoprenoid-binding protein YceI
MAVHAGRQKFGPERGRIGLLTTRDGLAAQAGHDLTIEVTQWSAELEVADDHTLVQLTVRVDMNSLIVRAGKGGVKSLTDRDRREIAVTARKLLRADRFPTASFTASGFDQGPDGGGTVRGTLSLGGSDRPVRLEVTRNGSGGYHATGSVRQSDFGIKPYTAFLGVLKVSDAVGIVVDVDLPDAADTESGSGEQS